MHVFTLYRFWFLLTPDMSVTPGSKLLCYWKYLNMKIYRTFSVFSSYSLGHYHSNSTHRIWGEWRDNGLFEWLVFILVICLSASWLCWTGDVCPTHLSSPVPAGVSDRIRLGSLALPRRGAVECRFGGQNLCELFILMSFMWCGCIPPHFQAPNLRHLLAVILPSKH